jgi:hypothetical protein
MIHEADLFLEDLRKLVDILAREERERVGLYAHGP